MPGLIDYAQMVEQLNGMGLLGNVASPGDFRKKGLNPIAATEGAVGYGGGSGSIRAYRGAKELNEAIGMPAWFSTNINTANTYAGARNPVSGAMPPQPKPGAQVQPVDIVPGKSLKLNNADIMNLTPRSAEKYAKQGYNSVHYTNERTGETWYVPLSAGSVSSAISKKVLY
jgi:hypothetical protein